MKSLIVTILVLAALFLAIGFTIRKLDYETGGWDTPKEYISTVSHSHKFPTYSNEILYKWETWGTQQWRHYAKYRIPDTLINLFADSITNQNPHEIGVRVLGSNAYEFIQDIEDKPFWFVDTSGSVGTRITKYYLGILKEEIWINEKTGVVLMFKK